MRLYRIQHYYRRSEHYRARQKVIRARTKDRILRCVLVYLSTHPCVDCGESDPIVLEFDHRDPTTKKFDVCTGINHGYSQKAIMEEIPKCDVRCANCHRRKTAEQVGYRKIWLITSSLEEAEDV